MSFTEEITIAQLRMKAEHIRKRVIDSIFRAKGGHTGGALSSVDILTALYFDVLNIDPANPGKTDRDRFIMSKGHSVESLYGVLVEAGFFDEEVLQTYGQFNSILAGHPTKKVPGVELNSGALGHGLSVGVGMAVAAKMDQSSYRVFVLMGDGEQGEGSIYEAAMSASHYKLDNLIAIIDRNRLQISGKTEDVMTLEPMKLRWESFGWEVLEVDGHNLEELIRTFQSIPIKFSKPHLIIAHTIKGKGISFIENKAKWHHGVPNQEQCNMAMKEINDRIDGIIVVLPNFGDELGVVNTINMAKLGVPVLVQACDDDNGKVDVYSRRDAFCGKISVCNNLVQYGIPFTDTTFHTYPIDSDTFEQDLNYFASICRVVNGLSKARIGAIGARPGAFQTMRASEKLLQASGITVVPVDLSEIFGAAGKIDNQAADLLKKIEEIKAYGKIPSKIKEEKIALQAKFGLAVENWIGENESGARPVFVLPHFYQRCNGNHSVVSRRR